MSKYHDISLAQCNSSFNHDCQKLEASIKRATALGFDVSSYPARIATALASMHPMVDALTMISTASCEGAPVTTEEFDIVLAASGQIGSMQHTLDVAFGVHDQYLEHLARHHKLIAEGKNQPRVYRISEGTACNTILEMHIRRAASPSDSANRSTAAFASCIEALKALDLQKAQADLTAARSFATGEYFLDVLLRRGSLQPETVASSHDEMAAVA